MRKSFLAFAAAACIITGAAIDYGPTLDSVPGLSWFAASKPALAIVVRESGDPLAITKAQAAWIMSPELRADCKAAGIAFYAVDPDVKDKTDNTPKELAAAIQRATAKGLPRLILVGSKGGITDFALPADEAAAHKRIIGG